MKNLYFYLAGIALLASGAEMARELSGETPTAHEWVAKPTKNTGTKSQEKVPFARARKKAGTKAMLAPSISATNAYAIISGGATAGGVLEYTVVINNTGPDPATATSFTETIDVNTTLVGGSLVASPIAVNDSYSTIGNVGIDVPAAQGILSNDVSPAGTALSVNSATTVTTTGGGTATITAATGAFTYNPAAGYTGNDTFTYEVQNGSGMTSTATVTIAVGSAVNVIWFINSGAAAGGDGTLARPFNSIASFSSINDGSGLHPKDGQFVFIYTGSYTDALTLRNNQKVIGQGATATLLSITGLSAPSGNNLLPATNGTRPTLTTSGGTVNAINLGANNNLRGFNVGNTSGTKISGTTAGTLNVSEVGLSGSGSSLNLGGKTLDANFSEVTSTSATGSVSPIKIATSTGSLTIGSGSITATSVPAIDINSSIALNISLTAVSANGGARGIAIANTTGTFNVNGSGTTAGSGGTIQNITNRGIELQNTAGITIKNMNLVNANQNDGTIPSGSGSDMANGAANAAVYALNTNGLTLDRVVISGTVAQEGINLRNSSNFNFTNGSIGASGTSGISTEGCIFAVNTGGSNSIVNSTLSDPGGRVAYFANFSTNMTLLTVDNSVFQNANGAAGLQVIGYGNANMKVKVQNNSRFFNCRTAGVEVYANNTAQMTAEIKNSVVDPGSGVGRGFDVAAFNDGATRFNIESNNVKHNNGIGINAFANANANIEGTIKNNTTNNYALVNGISGIVASVEGVTGGENAPEAIVSIEGNTVQNTTNGHGIVASALSTGGAKSHYVIRNNNIQVTGPIAWYGIDVNTPAQGAAPLNTATICAYVSGNAVNLSVPTNFAYRARAGNVGNVIQSQGTGASIPTVWDNNGNTPAGRAFPSGSGSFTYGATCLTPGSLTFREGLVEVLPDEKITAPSAAPVEQNAPETAAVQPEVAAAQPEVAAAQPESAAAAPVTLPSKPAADEPAETTIPSPARTEAAQAGETVTVNGTGSGFTLPAGKSTTIKFRVTINANIPASVCQLSTQGTVSGSNFASVLTDDPNTAGTNNPTTTTVTSTPVITSCPGNQTFSPDPGTCTSTKTFAATADACPAATLTYRVNGNPITFPYTFPAGETTVVVTASNGIGTAPTCSFNVTVTPTPAPPITDEPDAVTICAGTGTSFTVASSQAGVTYQWQKKPFGGSFANITTGTNPTADDATLVLTNVPTSDNLSEYRCIITNPCNNSTSAAAVLTVKQITASTLTGTTAVNQGTTPPVVTFGATGGTLPYTFTYKVNGGSNQTVATTGVNTTATVAQPTGTVGVFTYELVTVTDAQNCTRTPSPAQTATVTVSNNLTATISGSTNACQGDAQPAVTFTAVNGIAPFTFTYKINGGTDLTVTTTGANTTATVNVPTSVTGNFVYSLTNVSGAGGASTPISGQTATVNVGLKPTIALSGQEYQCTSDLNTYTVFFTATDGAVITTDKGTVSGNTVIGIPSKETATIIATLGACSDTLLAYKDCSLPVTLIDFTGSKVEKTVSLKWRTAEETNSDRFEIQRSTNAKNWSTIGTQKSNGESYAVLNYSFIDKQPEQGDNFYRLKMVDADRTFAYSTIIKVSFAELALKSEFYPNPVSEVLHLKSTDWSQVKSVEMHNMTGTAVYKSGKTVSKTIDVKNIPVGMYILTITHQNGEVINRKVLINR